MNFPKQVQTRSVIFLLVCMLVISSVSVYYGLSASTPTSGLTDIYVEPPLMEPSYIIGIYTVPSTCYLKNGTTGQITTSGTFYTAIQTAIDSLSTTSGGSGGKILIRGGSYNLTHYVTIQSGDIWIEGEGQGLVTINYDLVSSGYAMFYYGLVNQFFFGGFKNILFHGYNVANTFGISVLGNVSDLIFQDCTFLNFDNAVILSATGGAGQSKIWNFWFTRCMFEDNLHAGIYFTVTTDPLLRMIDRIKITECHFYDNLNSIYCDTQYVYHLTFSDNTIQAERNSAINVSNNGGGRQWIITNNHIFDCGIGANGTLAGIFVNGSWVGGNAYPDSWLIENNIIANHFTSSPVAMNNSVWLTDNCRNMAVQNNFFYATNPIRLDGLNRTQDPLLYFNNNVGFVTESAGSAANCVNGTAIPHGLAGTPTSLTLTMYGQNYINSTCWYLPPTWYQMNVTHVVILFNIFNAGVITAVAAPNSRTVYWIAVYKP